MYDWLPRKAAIALFRVVNHLPSWALTIVVVIVHQLILTRNPFYVFCYQLPRSFSPKSCVRLAY